MEIEQLHKENRDLVKKYNIRVGQKYKNKKTNDIITISHITKIYNWVLDDKGNTMLKTQTPSELINDWELIQEENKNIKQYFKTFLINCSFEELQDFKKYVDIEFNFFKNKYIFNQLENIKKDDNNKYDLIKIQIRTENTKTNWINLTQEQFNKIKGVLKND